MDDLPPRVVALGELLWDLLPEGPSLGGAPANLAYHATRAGGQGALISRVGVDELGARAVRQLAAAGVDVAWVGRDGAHPTGTVEVRFEAGEPSYAIGGDAAWDHLEIPADLGAVDAVAFGTLAARTDQASERILDLVREIRALRPPDLLPRPLLALDLNLRPPHVNLDFIRQVLPLVDLLKLNAEESTWLRAQTFGTDQPRIVAITRGAGGAELSLYGASHVATGVPVCSGDPIGAGDAFLASLLVELLKGTLPEMCLERANRYAAGVAAAKGAMPP